MGHFENNESVNSKHYLPSRQPQGQFSKFGKPDRPVNLFVKCQAPRFNWDHCQNVSHITSIVSYGEHIEIRENRKTLNQICIKVHFMAFGRVLLR